MLVIIKFLCPFLAMCLYQSLKLEILHVTSSVSVWAPNLLAMIGPWLIPTLFLWLVRLLAWLSCWKMIVNMVFLFAVKLLEGRSTCCFMELALQLCSLMLCFSSVCFWFSVGNNVWDKLPTVPCAKWCFLGLVCDVCLGLTANLIYITCLSNKSRALCFRLHAGSEE